MSLKISRIATFAATLAAVGAMSIATAPASAALRITPTFKNWVVSGSLTAQKLLLTNKVTLPEGSTFNGKGELFLETVSGTILGSGTITGSVFVPPFNTTLTLPINEIPTPVSVGITFTQVGAPAEGTVKPATGCTGTGACVTVSVPTEAIVGFTVVNILGIKVPTQCETVKPITLSLSATLNLLEIVTKGTTFNGTATIPPIKCPGLKGIVLGPVLSTALSGPGNPYTITLSPPPPEEEA